MPNSLDFDLGWFEGNSKKWLVVPDDLASMYSKYNGGEISLWCDLSVEKSTRDLNVEGHGGKISKILLELYIKS